jgi:hypothetical protein
MKRLQDIDKRSISPADAGFESSSLCEIIRQCAVSESANSFGGQLQAIVLTGSMARKEASFVRNDDSWEILGDAEFLLVFKKRAALPSARDLRNLRQQIESALRRRKIECTIDLSSVHPAYLRNLPPHIFSYELKHCGQIIWGDDSTLQLIPDFAANDLSLEDAWRLLCNRMLEILECAEELSNESQVPSVRLQYRVLKLHLDMATSFLVFVRAYKPTYEQRRAALWELANQPAPAQAYPVEVKYFAERVAYCTDRKLQRSTGRSFDVSWRSTIQIAHSLWRWELTRLAGVRESLSDRDLFEKWLQVQPLDARVRGWLYVLRARGWRKGFRNWPRWLRLSRKASPRYCTYLVASTLLFQLEENQSTSLRQGNEADWTPLEDLLPLGRTVLMGNVQASWETLASEVILNYKEFLVGTRA